MIRGAPSVARIVDVDRDASFVFDLHMRVGIGMVRHEMTAQRQLEELERVAGELAVRVCYEPMAGLVQGIGGLCKVRGEYRVIIDRRLRAPERVNILADALRRFDLRGIEIGDPLRRILRAPLDASSGAPE